LAVIVVKNGLRGEAGGGVVRRGWGGWGGGGGRGIALLFLHHDNRRG